MRATTREIGFRDGASVGYLLRKHRYPRRVVARMLVRPARRRRCSRRSHATWIAARGTTLATLRGRIARLPRGEALEELRVTLEPGLEREALDRPRARRGRVRR